MQEFYRVIEEMDPNHQNVVLTVLGGKEIGEKALLSGEKLVWTSKAGGFFSGQKESIEGVDGGGIIEIGGNRVFCELLGQEKKMVICGGGHVSMPLIQMGRMAGFHVTVLEDRPKFAGHARREKADRVLCEPFDSGLAQIEGDEDTYFVIVTRGHRYDRQCLFNIAKKKHAYIGMMGSRKRAALVKEAVIEDGADKEAVENVHTPIGLDIGAETPEEIAVAIMGQIIEVKSRKRKRSGYSREIMEALQTGQPGPGKRVMATIVGRKGPVPRGTGTKMLVLEDGSCVGTIGGGCAEAEICQRALQMLRCGKKEPELCPVDMTGKDAEDEGMACGGVMDVFLEVV